MSDLARRIVLEEVDEACVAIYWLCQAGFVFKGHSGRIVYVDPYFSDVVERVFGFKRMMPCPVSPEEVTTNLVACTHEHLDHMDLDALPIIATNHHTHFAGPAVCVKEFRKMGVPEERCHLIEEGTELTIEGIKLKGVFADHGELAPDAVGIVFEFDETIIYHTGDTAYRPESMESIVAIHPDVIIPCINGRYGNMDAREAAQLVRDINPRLAIPSHFWMFVEANGDPGSFLEACSELAPEVQAIVMKPGERILFRRA